MGMRRDGCGSTFEAQRLLFAPEYLNRRPVAQHRARRVVAAQRAQRQLLVRRPVQVRLPRQRPPQPAYRVLHSPFLPRRPHVAEERLRPYRVQLVMPRELRPVVERHAPPHLQRQSPQRSHHRLRDRLRPLALRPQHERQARRALARNQQRLLPNAEQHRVRLPVAELDPVGDLRGPLRQRAALTDEHGGTAPLAGAPAPLRLRLRQVMPPAVVLLPLHLAVE